jgi:hypothetical protein
LETKSKLKEKNDWWFSPKISEITITKIIYIHNRGQKWFIPTVSEKPLGVSCYLLNLIEWREHVAGGSARN